MLQNFTKHGTKVTFHIHPTRRSVSSHMTMDPIQQTFLELRPFERVLTCSILIAEAQVMLRKAYFLRRGSWLRPESWTDPKSRTVLLRRTHQRTYVQNFSSLDAIPAEK
jgi:hypothetical protein